MGIEALRFLKEKGYLRFEGWGRGEIFAFHKGFLYFFSREFCLLGEEEKVNWMQGAGIRSSYWTGAPILGYILNTVY